MKRGRKPTTCKHGVTPKYICKLCRNEYAKINYHKNYSAQEFKENNPEGEYPYYDLSEKGRAFVKHNYWANNPIAKFFLENRCRTPQ